MDRSQIQMAKFVPRDRKKRKARKGKLQDEGMSDTNALEVVPTPVSEKERKKKEMKDNIRAQQPAMSSKKSKRLDKYIVRR